MALTKKQEQELRAAQAEEARIKKLEEQLEAARAKVAERSANRQKEILSAIRRKKVARRSGEQTFCESTGVHDAHEEAGSTTARSHCRPPPHGMSG